MLPLFRCCSFLALDSKCQNSVTESHVTCFLSQCTRNFIDPNSIVNLKIEIITRGSDSDSEQKQGRSRMSFLSEMSQVSNINGVQPGLAGHLNFFHRVAYYYACYSTADHSTQGIQCYEAAASCRLGLDFDEHVDGVESDFRNRSGTRSTAIYLYKLLVELPEKMLHELWCTPSGIALTPICARFCFSPIFARMW